MSSIIRNFPFPSLPPSLSLYSGRAGCLPLTSLYPGEDSNHRDKHAQDEGEADEELIQRASLQLKTTNKKIL